MDEGTGPRDPKHLIRNRIEDMNPTDESLPP